MTLKFALWYGEKMLAKRMLLCAQIKPNELIWLNFDTMMQPSDYNERRVESLQGLPQLILGAYEMMIDEYTYDDIFINKILFNFINRSNCTCSVKD